MAEENLVSTTRSYYDSKDADEFYYNVWGGEDIHIGLYKSESEPISKASKRTVEKMASIVPLSAESEVLDIGAGYGGAARYLADIYGSHVKCLNLSEKENERNRQRNKEVGLDHLVDVEEGNFEALPYDNEIFDVVWCQDAILHSDNKPKVFEEVYRVLKEGGHFIFTDPMQSDDCPDGVLSPILARIHLKELGSVARYLELADKVGLQEVNIEEKPDELINHYSRVKEELEQRKEELSRVCSQEYTENMQKGLQHWINGGKNGYLNWGILHFKK